VVKRCGFDAQGPLFEPHFPQVSFARRGAAGCIFSFFYGRGPAHHSPPMGCKFLLQGGVPRAAMGGLHFFFFFMDVGRPINRRKWVIWPINWRPGVIWPMCFPFFWFFYFISYHALHFHIISLMHEVI
jgi:hypothetical protein